MWKYVDKDGYVLGATCSGTKFGVCWIDGEGVATIRLGYKYCSDNDHRMASDAVALLASGEENAGYFFDSMELAERALRVANSALLEQAQRAVSANPSVQLGTCLSQLVAHVVALVSGSERGESLNQQLLAIKGATTAIEFLAEEIVKDRNNG